MSYSPMTHDGVAMRPAVLVDTADRIAYLRKVYGLLFLGIVVFALAAALPVYGFLAGVPALRDLFVVLVQIPWWAALLVIFGTSWVAHSVSMIPRLNLVVFFAYSIVWGFLTVDLVAYAMLATVSEGASQSQVLAGLSTGLVTLAQALGLTVLTFGGLSGYVLVTRKDFSMLRGFLATGLFVLIGAVVLAGIASMLGYDMSVVQLAIAVVSVILFSGYVLYDTSNILNHYATDMVVPGALALLVDFIILFRSILFLLMRARD
jgi:modulator of FtsH protease